MAHAYILMTAGRQEEAEAALAPITSYGCRIMVKPFDLDELLSLVAEEAQRLPGMSTGSLLHGWV